MKNIKQAPITLPKTDTDDQRIGHIIKKTVAEPKVVLLGFPSDEGVRRNNGRTGAAAAPDEIRKILYKLTPGAENRERFISLLNETSDAGNVKVSGDLETDQEVLGNIIGYYLKRKIIPVIIGGGHETAYGHFLGYPGAGLATSIFNLDAHTDVRPLKNGKSHSGSPFRQALLHESNCCNKYSVAGLQFYSVAKAHLRFIEGHKGDAVFKDQTNVETVLKLLNETGERCMATFDMDAVDQAFAPGVSAPCANGLKPGLWLKAACLTGKSTKVTSFDLCEVNPKFDQDGQTARLAALTLWHFLKGVSERYE